MRNFLQAILSFSKNPKFLLIPYKLLYFNGMHELKVDNLRLLGLLRPLGLLR